MRLEKIFQILSVPARSKTCKAMKGLVEEGSEAIDLDAPNSVQRCLPHRGGAARRAYEIAAYGTARAFAETLGETDVVDLLEQTLDEEKTTDDKLTALAQTVNQEANSVAVTNED